MNDLDVTRVAASVAAGYLLGSVPFAYLAARAAGVNILQVGTRNPGAANVFRSVSRWLGATVFVADVLKGAVAVVAARALGVPSEMAVASGAAAVIGHWAPLFLRFRGGAGLAPAIGAAVALSPIPGAVGLAVGLLPLPLLRNSGRCAMLGLIALAVTSIVVGPGWPVAAGAAGLAAMVFARHLVVERLGAQGAEKSRRG